MGDPARAAGFFPTTCWSQVGPGAGEEALERLARRYWRPIRDWLRLALKLDGDRAAELAQDFFAWTLESGFFAKADRERGRFRAFLKVALRNYALDELRRASASRRGGGRRFFSLDEPEWESGAEAPPEPADPRASRPDEALDARWRSDLVAAALQALEQELAAAGRAHVFATFRDYFLDPAPDVDYRAVAAAHGATVTDVSNWLARAKQRFREHLRVLVSDTVRDASALAEELRWLFGKEAR
jgi:RNA polymerase sigma-70 factor (ECF subfamily)